MSTEEATPTTDDVAGAPKLDVTIVIPAYNEENAIEAEIDHIHAVMSKTEYAYEIIVVDDHSADRTFEMASHKDCRVLRQPRNMGYGAALKRGFRAARSELVIITDADGVILFTDQTDNYRVRPDPAVFFRVLATHGY